MNGGGAVALLAFLPEAWNSHPELACYVIVGLGLMSVGVVLAAFVNPARHHSSLVFAQARSAGERRFWFWAWRCLVFASIFAFALAVSVVVLGAFMTLAGEGV
jgi:hypothetical protein